MAELWIKDFEKAKVKALQITRDVENKGRNQQPDPKQSVLMRGDLTQLQQDVSHLQQSLMAMSQNVQSYGVTRKEISRRGDLLSWLSDTVDQLQDAQRSGGRQRMDLPEMPMQDAHPNGAHRIGNCQTFQDELQEQDKALDALHGTVRNLKNMGGDISEELDVHCQLLDDIESKTDTVTSQINQQKKRLPQISGQTTGSLWCYNITVIIAIFVLLVFF